MDVKFEIYNLEDYITSWNIMIGEAMCEEGFYLNSKNLEFLKKLKELDRDDIYVIDINKYKIVKLKHAEITWWDGVFILTDEDIKRIKSMFDKLKRLSWSKEYVSTFNKLLDFLFELEKQKRGIVFIWV